MNKLEDLNPLFSPPSSNGSEYTPFEDRTPTLVNYYKFAAVSKINAYFYQVQDLPPKESGGISDKTKDEKISPLEQVHHYENSIKQQLARDYQISDVLTYGAKKEICIFRLETRLNPQEQKLGFNQLKDAVDNIIIECKLPLKLASATTFDADSVFKSQANPQQHSRPSSIVYLSFLRAVKKLLCQHLMARSSEVEILPFGNQSLVRSAQDTFQILKINTSLSIRNEILSNFAIINTPHFYRLSTLLDSEFDILKSNYALYLCPSGVRCSFANQNMLANSLSFEPPSNYEKLLGLLSEYSHIKLETPSRWIKLVPNLNHMNGLTPNIARYLETSTPNSKYFIWPASMCMIQFGDDIDEPAFEVSNSFELIEELILDSDEEPQPPQLPATERPTADSNPTDVDMDSAKESPGNWDELFGESLNEEEEDTQIDVPESESQSKPELVSSPVEKDAEHFIELQPSNPFYEDPGAPSPASFHIFASPSPETTDASSANDDIGSVTPKDLKKSIFAPLNFNPLIEKDIDSKYSDGGKFFVRSEAQTSRSQESASTTPTFWKNKKGETDIEERDLISDSEEEVEEDDDDDDDNDQTGLGISITSIPRNTGILSSITPFANQAAFSQPQAPSPQASGAQEIQNWLFWILRGPALCTIPSRFLSTGNPVISKDKIEVVLPILQELVLFTAGLKDHCQEQASDLSETLDSTLLSAFPGSSKLKLYELLDCDRPNSEMRFFDSLFGSEKEIYKLEAPRIDFDDPSFATTSPLMNITEIENKRQSGIFRENANRAILENVKSASLFKIPTTIFNTKRNDQEMKINETSLRYWKLLNLEPLEGQKNLKVILVVPKSTSYLLERSRIFLQDLMATYSSWNLGQMNQLQDILEIPGNDAELFVKNMEEALTSLADSLRNQHMVDSDGQTDAILIMIAIPNIGMQLLTSLASALEQFQSTVTVKSVDQETEEDRRKRRKKNLSTTISVPISSFYKVIPFDLYLSKNECYSVVTSQKLGELALEIYSLYPKKDVSEPFKDRDRLLTISKQLPQKIPFVMTKAPISSGLIADDLFLHVCYERSIDKNWCVASWSDQYGEINFTRSWFVGPDCRYQTFEEVSDEIFDISMDYVSNHSGKSYVILTRLNNVIPDDELTEWKRLSIKNNKLTLIVLTVELEPSTLILSHLREQKDDLKDIYSVKFTAASTNSQMLTPGMANRFESPINGQTPSYDPGASPLDAPVLPGSQQQVPENPELIELSNECYGVILQVAQQLSNQSIRMPLRTGFIVNSGRRSPEGYEPGSIIELNLLSCQAGVDSIELLKNLIMQYKHLANLNKDPICPWHVSAVRRMIEFLVHLDVK
ncbi:hypothetical protein KL911_004441 [Ogataea haglerorum]|uniref:uncharacterized protein n=1 Tax=Ogataea haglerorum TaxID=1937702 RepID=UPI001C89136C|nr:uncharacterized protein KL911_004441 [Ogataea haglerorum]KAG7751863.1 hypothetical protein KL911_004441 [Ogataea haglerorum]